MTTCIHQGNGSTYFDGPVHQSLLDVICKKIEYGSTVFTDECKAYAQLEEHGFVHKSITHSQTEYANGIMRINNCQCRSNLYQLWITNFMGVNKYNLQAYSKVFQFIHNSTNKTRGKIHRYSLLIST